ncbi:MAG: 4Fe-4S dicluster domain-containing protein [Verrucomicrobia bacterium]|nr:4Fe-4S dicluster domain-containing protein [Verrucomicrobiota bacterium]
MLHQIQTDKLGPMGSAMSEAVSTCVHCGFCLAACPTYRELGQEMDSPRGRIVLMKEVLEGKLPWEEAQPHVDRCLGCLSCEPACPSGVPYRDLISPFRAVAQKHFKRPFADRLRRLLTRVTLPYPRRFRAAMQAGGWIKKIGLWSPRMLRPMLDLIPANLPAAQTWPEFTEGSGPRRARVGLLLGCAQQVLDPDINTATIEVLRRNGVDVVAPRTQGCCGGLAWHTGDLAAARKFARQQLDAFPADVDAILSNAAGCGSAMHEYALVLRGTPLEDKARCFGKRVKDVSSFLHELGLVPPKCSWPIRVAYHDACHLANAQGVRDEPRSLLRSIPGLELQEISGGEFCCGSAGSYNLDEPQVAQSLGASKARAIIDTRAEIVASGNIGCLAQIRMHLEQQGSAVPARHSMQVLRDAYRRESTG